MDEQKRNPTGAILTGAGILLIVLFLIFGIRHLTRTVTEVRTADAAYTDIVSSVDTNGKVEPIREFQAHAAQPGVVQRVAVHEGETVTAGQLLLTIDPQDADQRVDQARASMLAAQAAQQNVQQGGPAEERVSLQGEIQRDQLQVSQSQHDLDALTALQARGAASASEVAAAQQHLRTAQDALSNAQQRNTSRYSSLDREHAQAQVADTRAALSAAEVSRSQSIIRAPFAGTVYNLPVRAYDFEAAGELLVQMADLSKVQVRAYFDEPEIGRLHNGQPVTIKWDARPGRVWHGSISQTPTTVITYGTRNVGQALIEVEDAAGDLLPNTNVNVTVLLQETKHALAVPREALRTKGSTNYVYLVRDKRIQRRDVQVGALNLMYVQITSGLQPGDVVALNATSNVDLTDNLQVQVAH